MVDTVPLDALSVCVSPRFRVPILRAARDRGLAIFVEKPWASNTDHARQLAEICEGNDAPVMCGFSFRFHPVTRRAIELTSGDLGAVRLGSGAYVFNWLPPADAWVWDPENGGGLFNENSCHLFDVVCALAGRPVELFAYGLQTGDRPSEAAATISLRFRHGGIVTLSAGGVGAAAVTGYPWLELHTAGGYLRLTGVHHVWRRLEWATRGASQLEQVTVPPEQLGRTRYTDALEHFTACIREHREPDATIEDGVLMVRIADAIRESFRTGKPVAIPEGGTR
jgi:predicted dehydrogenase